MAELLYRNCGSATPTHGMGYAARSFPFTKSASSCALACSAVAIPASIDQNDAGVTTLTKKSVDLFGSRSQNTPSASSQSLAVTAARVAAARAFHAAASVGLHRTENKKEVKIRKCSTVQKVVVHTDLYDVTSVIAPEHAVIHGCACIQMGE